MSQSEKITLSITGSEVQIDYLISAMNSALQGHPLTKYERDILASASKQLRRYDAARLEGGPDA